MTSYQDAGDAKETLRGASPAPDASAREATLSGMAADNREGKNETGHARWRPGIRRGETGAIPRYTGRKAIFFKEGMP